MARWVLSCAVLQAVNSLVSFGTWFRDDELPKVKQNHLEWKSNTTTKQPKIFGFGPFKKRSESDPGKFELHTCRTSILRAQMRLLIWKMKTA